MAEHDVAELVRQDRCQAGFIGKHVDQSAAEDDRMTNREGFESRSHQHAAANFGIDVNVVGHFKVVDDRFQNFVDFPLGAISPMRSRRSVTLSSAWRSQERCA